MDTDTPSDKADRASNQRSNTEESIHELEQQIIYYIIQEAEVKVAQQHKLRRARALSVLVLSNDCRNCQENLKMSRLPRTQALVALIHHK